MSISCPVPMKNQDKILLAHGSGGKFTSELIESLFLPAFGRSGEMLHDGAFLSIGGQELAFTTDSYVVQPLFFPGGNIGDLAVYGTINDLAMCGARPLYLSCGFILEEGFSLDSLQRIAAGMKRAADSVGAKLTAGDTKVVERGKGDGLYINTSGIGIIETEPATPRKIQPGDHILISGDIGRHGVAIMSTREGLVFDSEIESDAAELFSLVHALQQNGVKIHCLRDLTRGGLATALIELAETRGAALNIDERRIPIHDTVRGACEFLGLDPLYVACEGRMVLIVPPDHAEQALNIMKDYGAAAQSIGQVADLQTPRVTATTFIGTRRVLDLLSGDQLPRIC